MKSASAVKAVLFDLDGTLIDTAPDMAAALNHTLLQEGMPTLPLETIRPYVSRGGLALILLAFEQHRSEAEIEPLRLRFLDYYLHHIAEHSRLFEGYEAVLETLEQRSIAWGVVTNKPAWLTDPLMAALNLSQRSAITISGDTTAQRKPHPLPLITAAQAIGVPCEQCLYVGDDRRDIQAGKSAHMTTVIAQYGYIVDDSDLDSWHADQLITHPTQLLDLI
ncbi:MAG: phosphoglycolate phosphatase [Gammaproteobacteria bacterium]|nr:phosphoglycolate phosphatase [Gammaproteobacteria bacterium]MBL6998785.1 phosphoglycolate phosphatase [Gammaproteobacteria bacterium]